MTAYGPDFIGSMLAQEEAEMDAEDVVYCAQQDALDDLRAKCRLFDLVYYTTGGVSVPTQPVSHRKSHP